MDKYGLPEIDSWDSMINAFTTIAENENKNGMYVIGQRSKNELLYLWWQDHNMSYLQSGFDFMFDSHGTDELPNPEDIVYFWETDTFYDFCKVMVDLAKKNVWSPNVLNEQTDVQVQFESGRTAAMSFNSTIARIGANMENNGVGTYAIYDITPAAKASRGSYADGMMSIPVNCIDPERTMLVLDCMRGFPELNRLLVGGIEGRSWILREDGYREPGPESDSYQWGAWAWGINRFDDPMLYNEDERQMLFNKIVESKEIQPKSAGFTFDISSVEADLSVINSITEEYGANFTLGMYGDDLDAKYAEYKQKLKDAGIDRVMEEVRRQYQEYYDRKSD